MHDSAARLKAALADRYRVDREIGAGGMATVYLAEDVKHHRSVALKVLRPELTAMLGAERFLLEIETTAHLQHPSILPLYDSGQADGLLYYVMPFVEGETLRARLTRERQLPVEDAVRIAEAVAGALQYAHEHGVIHRDIKPENVLLQGGHALVADFGLALATSHAGGQRLTETGLSLGTPHYMSPEQAAGDRAIDARSDVYSLGAVLYEMLVGEPPHVGTSVQAVIAKILSERPAPIALTRGLVPVNVDAAVQKALAKSPADRFRTVADFASALRDVSFRLEPGVERATAPRRGDPRWRAAALVFGATAVLLALLLVTRGVRPGGRTLAGGAPVRIAVQLDEGQVLIPTGGSTTQHTVALSPDGSGMVYGAATPGTTTRLWHRRWASLEASELRESVGACCAAISPDGRSVAFLVSPPELRLISLEGGAAVTVADSGLADHLTYGGGVAWDGPDCLVVSGAGGLVRIPSSGGPLEPLSRIDTARGEVSHSWPHVLPNGRGAVFTIVPRSRAPRELRVAAVRFETGEVVVLGRGSYARYLASGHLVYAGDDGRLMVVPFDEDRLALTGPPVAVDDSVRVLPVGLAEFAVGDDGTFAYLEASTSPRRLVWVDRTGRAAPLQPEWVGGLVDPTLSPDGRRVVVAADGDLWLRDLESSQTVRFTLDGGLNDRPAWSPDGREITHASDRAGAVGIFRRSVDGTGGPREIPVADPRPVFGHAWSPDGRWLLLRTDDAARGAGDILGLRPGIDSVPRPLVASPASELTPAVSPDGRWLAYASNATGRFEIFVSPFPEVGEARWQVSTDGGTEPRWSRDGRELFFRDRTQNLIVATIASDPGFRVVRQRALFSLADFAERVWHPQFDVAPGAQRFLMLQRVAQPSNRLIVVFNWLRAVEDRAALRQRSP